MPSLAKFKKIVNGFQNSATPNRGGGNHHRYISYDICYNYFWQNRGALTADIEKSCCVLWSYLASWGMLRGSSFLLQKNPAYLVGLVEYIERDCQDVFEIDIDSYTRANIKRLLKVYDKIYKLLGGDKTHPSSTLITKIMLGVFGCVPAFDTYFCETFSKIFPRKGFTSKQVNEESLAALSEFYTLLSEDVDALAVACKVTDPFDANCQDLHYTKAKIVDMYGFNAGISKVK